MPTPIACPDWEYKDVDNHEAILKIRTAQVLKAIFDADPAAMIRIIKDTRRVHRPYFFGLTPPGFEYYAGNYRGSPFACLREYKVGIQSDPRVGHPPGIVSRSMYEFATEAQDTLTEIDRLFRVSDNVLSKAEKLLRTVQLFAALFGNSSIR